MVFPTQLNNQSGISYQNIMWFDIMVHNPTRVKVDQGVGQLNRNPDKSPAQKKQKTKNKKQTQTQTKRN